MRRYRNYYMIALTFLFALLLTLLPLPQWAEYLWPHWVMLVVIYWAIFLPEYVGVGVAWCVGLLLDVVQGAVLGQYALCLMIVTYLTYRLHYQLRVFPLWQQSIAVFLFISLAELLALWINALMGERVFSYWQHWISILVSAALWPWISALLRAYQLRYRIQ